MNARQVCPLFIFIALGCSRWRQSEVPVQCDARTYGTFERKEAAARVPDSFMSSSGANRGRLAVRLVRGDSTRTPVAQALVQVIATSDSNRTDTLRLAEASAGLYTAELPAGSGVLLVRRIGFEVHRESVHVRPRYADTLQLALRLSCLRLE
jgi:hypothetical protein